MGSVQRPRAADNPDTPNGHPPSNGSAYDPSGWEDIKGPCPVCEKKGWCRRSADGGVISCRREPNGAFAVKTDSNGSPVYLHRIGPEPDRDRADDRPPRDRSKPLPPAAPPDTRHDVYSALLDALHLSPEHRASLTRRGLSGEEIDRREYRSKGKSLGVKLVSGLAERFGEDTLLAVPGFIRNRAGRLDVACLPGLLIPVRDGRGRIAGLMVRPDRRLDGGCKYRWVSSARHGGPSPGAPAHTPLGMPVSQVWRLTEGALKADVAAVRSGLPTIGAPGVTNWRVCLPPLRGAGCKAVRLAFDADARGNKVVAAALLAAYRGLRDEGYEVQVERWDGAKAKGIDDALAGGVAVELLSGGQAEAVVLDAARAAGVTGRDDTAGPPPEGEAHPGGRLRPTPGVIEAPDDPHRLARGFVAECHAHPDHHTLVHHAEDFHEYRDGCYRMLPAVAVEKELTASIKREFDRLCLREKKEYKKALAEYERTKAERSEAPEGEAPEGNAPDGPPRPPVARKVKGTVFNDAMRALRSCVSVPHTLNQPCWLTSDGDEPKPRDVIPTRGGLVDLSSLSIEDDESIDLNKIKVYEPSPAFFSPTVLNYPFDPAAPRPDRWLTFLNEIFPDDPGAQRELQKWFGYLISLDTTHQKMLYLIGRPRSGKGTILRVLTELVGPENVTSPALVDLSEPFGLSESLGKSLMTISDARIAGDDRDLARLQERLLKISGEDWIQVNRKNRPLLTTKLLTRIVIVSNELPGFKDMSGAFRTRARPLRFLQTFEGKEDTDLFEGKLKPEMPGILNWSIAGRAMLKLDGGFRVPESAAGLVKALEESASPIHLFLTDCCVTTDPKATAIKEDLFLVYRWWCARTANKVSPVQTFGKLLRGARPELDETRLRIGDEFTDRDSEKRVWAWRGVTLQPGVLDQAKADADLSRTRF